MLSLSIGTTPSRRVEEACIIGRMHKIQRKIENIEETKMFFKSNEVDEHKFRCQKRRILECVFCNFTFKSSQVSALKDHMEKFHCLGTAFPCKICTRTIWTKKCLSAHVRARHPETLPFKCSFCKRKYALPSTLQAQAHKKMCKKNKNRKH